MSRVALWNGKPAEVDESAGRLLGLTVFETLSVERGALVEPQRHLARLEASAATVGLAPDGGFGAVEDALDEAVRLFEAPEGIVRVSLHARARPWGLRLGDPTADVLVLASEPRYPDLSQGVAAITSTVRAPAPEAFPPHVKGPCLPRYLAYREALGRGAFEALLLDARGHAVSGSRSNLFAVIEGVLVAAPAPPAFPGITRSRVLAAALTLGHEPAERPLHRDELPEAGELFVTLTGPGIVPIVALDGAPVGDGAVGPVTRRLRGAL